MARPLKDQLFGPHALNGGLPAMGGGGGGGGGDSGGGHAQHRPPPPSAVGAMSPQALALALRRHAAKHGLAAQQGGAGGRAEAVVAQLAATPAAALGAGGGMGARADRVEAASAVSGGVGSAVGAAAASAGPPSPSSSAAAARGHGEGLGDEGLGDEGGEPDVRPVIELSGGFDARRLQGPGAANPRAPGGGGGAAAARPTSEQIARWMPRKNMWHDKAKALFGAAGAPSCVAWGLLRGAGAAARMRGGLGCH